MAYRWITSGSPCTKCIGMSQNIYPSKPKRPHKYCLCAFVKVSTKSGKPCINNQILIDEVTFIASEGENIDGENPRLTNEFEVKAICPDGTKVNVFVVIDIDASQIKVANREMDETAGSDEKFKEWYNRQTRNRSEMAINKAMPILKQLCPACPKQKQRSNS